MAGSSRKMADNHAATSSATSSFRAGFDSILPEHLDVTNGAETARIPRNGNDGNTVLGLSAALASTNATIPSEVDGLVSVPDEEVSSMVAQARSSPGSEVNATNGVTASLHHPQQIAQLPNGTANPPVHLTTEPFLRTLHDLVGMVDHMGDHLVTQAPCGELEVDEEESLPARR